MTDYHYDQAASTLRTLADDISRRAHIATGAADLLGADGFSGSAAAAATQRFRGLGQLLERVAEDVRECIPALLIAHVCDQVCRQLLAALGRVQHVPTAAQLVALTELERHRINLQVAAWMQATAGHVPEPAMTWLYDQPEVPLSRVHAGAVAGLDPGVRELVDKHSGVVLEAGSGGIAVLLGSAPHEVDTLQPEAITTVVAGTGSSAPDAIGNYLRRGETLVEATGDSTVVWLGYTAPETVFFDAASARYAQEGADNLSFFQAALRERFPTATTTVLAHSYGTVTAAEAAATHGLHADNLLLMASPGVPATTAGELHLHSRDPHVYVADSVDDVIRQIRGPVWAFHGMNPASPLFGARQILGVGFGGHSVHWDSPAVHAALREMNGRSMGPHHQ